jgi:hypothetical protein
MTHIFTEEDFNSNDGFSTLVWGPLMWQILHIISMNYPANPTEKDKDHYHNFLMSLQHVLPCGQCRENFPKNLKKLNYNREHLKDRKTFSKFIYDLHSEVNKMLGKKTPLSFNEVRTRFEMFRARCIDKVPIIPKYKEKGCVNPVSGIKSKCIVHIVPENTKCDTFNVDPRCLPKKPKLKRSSTKKSKRSRSKSRSKK